MRRPIGLILSAIVLSLAALFLLLMTALMAFGGFFTAHQPSSVMAPHLVMYFMFAFSAIYAALAVWAILTVIGILRLRPGPATPSSSSAADLPSSAFWVYLAPYWVEPCPQPCKPSNRV